MATVNGTSGNDFVHVLGDGLVAPGGYSDNTGATDSEDTINSGLGGSDIIHAGAGNDTINFGNDLDASDQVDGGFDFDVLAIYDQTSVVFGANSLTSIEEIYLPALSLPVGFAGFQSLTMNDANVTAGNTLLVDGSQLSSDTFFTFDGSAESDGHFTIYGGQGSDTLTGGKQKDIFHLEYGGNDTATSGGGIDIFYFGDAFTAADTVIADKSAGGRIELFGTSYAGGITLGATTMRNVTDLWLDGGANYTITLNDGNVAKGKLLTVDGYFLAAGKSLTFDGSAETDGSLRLDGGDGNDVLVGGAKADTFDLFAEGNIIFGGGHGGGADTAVGGGGSDQFLGLIEGDVIDGGAGFDTATAVTPLSDFQFDFAANTIISIEKLIVGGLFYVMNDANVAAGKTLIVEGHAGSFDGSAETDGHFKFVQDGSNSTFKGGALKDTFDVTGGGGSHLLSNGGNDVITVGAAFDQHDEFDGGTGIDTVSLAGDYSAGLDFLDTTIVGVEKLLLGQGFSYKFTSADANVAAGQTLTVDAHTLLAANSASFDGSAETDGNFEFLGGKGADIFKGGAGADHFIGGLKHDTLTGGFGADRFIYTALANSGLGTKADVITDFSRTDGDRIDLSAIDAIAGTAPNNAFHFVGTALFSHTAGELRFEKSGGSTFITGDVNGDAVADFEITLTGKIGMHAADFIL